MTEYLATPPSSGTTPFAPLALSISTTTVTLLQVAVPSTTDIMVLGWGVSFNGAAGGTQVPVTCWLVDDATGCTAGTNSLTPVNWGNAQAPASLCVGGTSATAYGPATIVTPSGARMLDSQYVSPQAGYAVLWQDDRQPRVNVSRFLKVNAQAPAAVSVIPWILWAEPAV